MKQFLTKTAKGVAATGAAMVAFAQQAYAINVLGDSGNIQKPKGFASDLGAVINSVLSFVMVIAALLVLFYLVLGGIEWITSGGEKGKTEAARNKITAAIIGLVILAASFAVFTLVIRFLGFESTQQIFNVTPIGN